MSNFIINEIFGQGAMSLTLTAMLGLALQKESVEDITRGTVMTATGFFVLSQGIGIVTGNSIGGLVSAFSITLPQASGVADIDMSIYGTQIGIVMLLVFAVSLVFARLTKWKAVFLTSHMLHRFPYVSIAVGADVGLIGGKLIGLAAIFTAVYMITSPNILFPYAKAVTGDSSLTTSHPTTCLPLLADTIAKFTGDKSHSTEDIKFPRSLNFLHEVLIIDSFVIAITYIVMFSVLEGNGLNPGEVWGYIGGTTGISTYIFTKAICPGVGVTILLLGICMLIVGITPAFEGIAKKVVPGAISAFDCPLLLPFAPNVLIIGLIAAVITSTLTILLTAGMFPTVITPLTFIYFFEIGYAAVTSNAQGGVRGCIIGTVVAGIIMVFLVGFGSCFFGHTINNWMLVYGGQDFSLWGIAEGLIAGLIA